MLAIQCVTEKALGRIGSTFEHPIILDGHQDRDMTEIYSTGTLSRSYHVRTNHPKIVDLTCDDECESFLVAKYTTPTRPKALVRKRGHRELTADDDTDGGSSPRVRKRHQPNYPVPGMVLETPTKPDATRKTNLRWAHAGVIEHYDELARHRASQRYKISRRAALPFTDRDHVPDAPMVASKGQPKNKRGPTLPVPPAGLQDVWDQYARDQERRQRGMAAAKKRRGFSAMRREMREEDDRAFNCKATKSNVDIPCDLPNDLGDLATRSWAQLRKQRVSSTG